MNSLHRRGSNSVQRVATPLLVAYPTTAVVANSRLHYPHGHLRLQLSCFKPLIQTPSQDSEHNSACRNRCLRREFGYVLIAAVSEARGQKVTRLAGTRLASVAPRNHRAGSSKRGAYVP